MRITSRQIGKIEAACFGLETATVKDATARRLVNTIREVADDVLAERDRRRADREDGIPEFCCDGIVFGDVIAYGREIVEQGAGLVEAVRMIRDHFGLTQGEFAAILGTSQTTVSMAETDTGYRRTLLAKMAELFGTPGGAAKDGE